MRTNTENYLLIYNDLPAQKVQHKAGENDLQFTICVRE